MTPDTEQIIERLMTAERAVKAHEPMSYSERTELKLSIAAALSALRTVQCRSAVADQTLRQAADGVVSILTELLGVGGLWNPDLVPDAGIKLVELRNRLAAALAQPDAGEGLALSIQQDPLAITELLADNTRERHLYYEALSQIREVLGEDGRDALLTDLPNVVADRLATPADAPPALTMDRLNDAAKAEAVLAFAHHIGPLGDSVRMDTERLARWFIQQQGWPLPAAERTQP